MAITNIYKGSTDVTDTLDKIYLGDTLLWEKPIAIQNYVIFKGTNIQIGVKYTNSGITLQYSIDSGSNWVGITSGNYTPLSPNNEIWLRGRATGTKSLYNSQNATNAWNIYGTNQAEIYGDLSYLLCDELGDLEAPKTLNNFAFNSMFRQRRLKRPPELRATTLGNDAYAYMFEESIYDLMVLPKLPATVLGQRCYNAMFAYCGEIKVSTTQGGIYQYEWRVPEVGSSNTPLNWNLDMFAATGGTFKGRPVMGTTYYTDFEPV